MWDPGQYRRFKTERSRPFFDLLSQVDIPNPLAIADLGCGTGDQTAALAERWPQARVWGVDNSPEMIKEARRHSLPGRLSFEFADLADWQPPGPLDMIVSNAAFQWVGNHEALIHRLISRLTPTGALAFQVPAEFQARHIFTELRNSPAWIGKIGHGASLHELFLKPGSWYVELLSGLGFRVDSWETLYHHVLAGEDAVMEWFKGSMLRPVLSVLSPEEQTRFLNEYKALLRPLFPRRPFGTLLSFPRIFVIAYRIP